METSEAQKKAFGTKLREHREALELTLKELVDALAEHDVVTSVSTVSGWERGESSPRDRKIVRVLDALLLAEGELASTLDITLARPGTATAFSTGSGPVDLGPLLLRRLRGEELSDNDEEALGTLDTIEDGRYAVESVVFALAQEVGTLILMVDAIAEHVGWVPADLQKLRNELAHTRVGGFAPPARWGGTVETIYFEDDDVRQAASSGGVIDDIEVGVATRPTGVPEEPDAP